MKVHGLHHVTAVSAHIQTNLEFYTGRLGLRLIKKSVNQDDVQAYHLFYSDGAGTAGTDLTFFDWPMAGNNRTGIGTITQTGLRVDGETAIAFWADRLKELGIERSVATTIDGRATVQFTDPEGQPLAFVDGAGLPNDASPFSVQGLDSSSAYRGLHSITIRSGRPDSSAAVLQELLGLEVKGEFVRDGISTTVLAASGENSYSEVHLENRKGEAFGQVGAGGVHHVAFRVKDDAALLEFQRKLEAAGVPTSGYVDRYYFHSLYFREPSGVLYELATDGPGMGGDEPIETAGSRLSLPPFLENQRAAIESGLKPLPQPTYGF